MALSRRRAAPRDSRPGHRSRRLARAVVPLAALALLAPQASAARADQTPVFPSQAQVDASKRAAAARADRVGQIEAQLAAANARADRLATEVGQAVEAYNGARLRLQRAEAAAAQAGREADAAQARVGAAREALGRFAAAAYRSGGDLGGLSTFLFATSPRDLISRASALQSIGDSRRTALDDFRSAQAYATVLDARARDLVARRRDAAAQVARAKAAAETRLAGQQQAVGEIAAQRETLVRQLAAARHTSVRLEKERQAGLERARAEAARRAAERRAAEAARRAEQARQEAAARAAEQARQAAAEQARQAEEKRNADEAAAAARAAESSSGSSGSPSSGSSGSSSGGGSPSTDNGGGGGGGAASGNQGGSSSPDNGGGGGGGGSADPVPSGSSSGSVSGAQAAIAFARAQIGKPYEWAADGPSTFDCSGLTMRAWEQGGVSLPHYSVAQYEQSEKVAISDLRPGDLVFFASGSDYHSIYHVGLYLGDGLMIEAPYTGEDVRVSSIWRSSLFGAARP